MMPHCLRSELRTSLMFTAEPDLLFQGTRGVVAGQRWADLSAQHFQKGFFDTAYACACMCGEQVMWNYMLTLSTFILTFFLKECYDYWGTAMDLSRRIQGICPPSCVRVFVGRERRRIGSKT